MKAASLYQLITDATVRPEGFAAPVTYANDRRAKPHMIITQVPDSPIVIRPMVTKWPYAHQEIRNARRWAGATLPGQMVHPVAVRMGGDGELLAITPYSTLMDLIS